MSVEKFWSRTTSQNGCVVWTGPIDVHGYGRFNTQGRQFKAHRWIMEYHLDRKLAADEFVLHSCDVRNCVKLAHLRVGTHLENIQDAKVRGGFKRGHPVAEVCPSGHDLTDDNVLSHAFRKYGWRICKTCRRDYQRRYREGKRNAAS